MNNDHDLGGIGDPMALRSHEANEAIEDHRYEQFERELSGQIESSDSFREGVAQIRIAFQEWESYCRDNGYDPINVDMMDDFRVDFFKLTGDII